MQPDPRAVLARFFNAFDLKDWDALGACLADEVRTDYSDLRGTPPETVTRDAYVALRRDALAPLRTQHLAGNVELTADGPRADAVVSAVIWRRDAAGTVFDTHCLYRFGLARHEDGSWRIDAIVQKVFWNGGAASNDGGALSPRRPSTAPAAA
jgi:ketosteroid isomerase-like protein